MYLWGNSLIVEADFAVVSLKVGVLLCVCMLGRVLSVRQYQFRKLVLLNWFRNAILRTGIADLFHCNYLHGIVTDNESKTSVPFVYISNYLRHTPCYKSRK
jgi:hypothetical protein